jgi:hypothetical protein
VSEDEVRANALWIAICAAMNRALSSDEHGQIAPSCTSNTARCPITALLICNRDDLSVVREFRRGPEDAPYLCKKGVMEVMEVM